MSKNLVVLVLVIVSLFTLACQGAGIDNYVVIDTSDGVENTSIELNLGEEEVEEEKDNSSLSMEEKCFSQFEDWARQYRAGELSAGGFSDLIKASGPCEELYNDWAAAQ